MNRKLRSGIALGTLLLGSMSVASMQAYAAAKRPNIKHVLLISVDGMHALDYLNCSKGIAGVNGGKPYCPNLAALGTSGANFLNAQTSRPSDSFPGLMALVSGGTPRTMGVNYDVAYDRALNPPQNDTGNGLLGTGSTCPSTPSGTSTEYDEGININVPGIAGQMFLNGGAPSGDGGINSIDKTRLVRDKNCNRVAADGAGHAHGVQVPPIFESLLRRGARSSAHLRSPGRRSSLERGRQQWHRRRVEED